MSCAASDALRPSAGAVETNTPAPPSSVSARVRERRFMPMRIRDGGKSVLRLAVLLLGMKLHPTAALAQGGRETFREVHLGMEMELVLVMPPAAARAASDHLPAADLARTVFDHVERLEQILSDWRATSELRRLESVPPRTWANVSPPLCAVLSLALDVAKYSDGRFDPTIGPLTALWREAARTGQPIHDSARAEAQRRVGYRALRLDRKRCRVRFEMPGMRLDLGAVAKGWIIDDALALVRRNGASAGMLVAGGDLAVFGTPDGALSAAGESGGWRIAVPRAQGDTVLVLTEGAVSTSGSSQQRAPALGGEESHVFDARVGRGATRAGDVTVVGARASVTDALATAVSLMNERDAERLARRYGVRIVSR
jgi:thiamine biosynthesis lipoprotein